MRKMKYSGVEWIGEIPEDWEIICVRHLFRIGRGRVIAQTELKEDGEFPVYSSQTMSDGCLGYLDTYDFDADQLTWTTDGANAGTVFLRRGKYNCTNVCGTLLPCSPKIEIRYQKYSLEYISFYHKRADTNGYKIMNNEMAAIKTIVPPIDTQRRIADFLDDKCGKIDRYIEKQQQIIDKLKEYKQAVITEAVTKGLNPDVPMKDSGIEWIGMIPDHWDIRRLRYLGSCVNGISKGGEFFGNGFPFVSYGDVYKNMELPKKVEGLVQTTDDEREWYSVIEGDVFFTRTSETIEEVALTSTCMHTIENATFAGFLIRFRPNSNLLTKEFSKFYFRSNKHRLFFVKEMNLVTRASLSQELLKRLPVLLPPTEEQQKIAWFLESKCSEIDSAISKQTSIIEKLTEYKKSLIYEAVTGKMEV